MTIDEEPGNADALTATRVTTPLGLRLGMRMRLVANIWNLHVGRNEIAVEIEW